MANEPMSFEGLQPDEKIVSTILESVHFLFTNGERAELEKLARQNAEIQAAAFRVMVKASDRYGKDDAQTVMNAREAAGRYFAGLSMPLIVSHLEGVISK